MENENKIEWEVVKLYPAHIPLALGNGISDLRDALELSQFDLAKRVGVSVEALAAIEDGGNCSLRTALKISAALDAPVCNVFWLIDLRTGKYLGGLPF